MAASRLSTDLKDPSDNYAAVTPADADIAAFRGLFVGGAGTVIVTSAGGASATFTCVAGTVLPVQGVRVGASSTATLIVALR